MATTVIAHTNIPANGLNLTSATFATLVAGASNGVEFPYHPNNILFLKNDTGGSVDYTISVRQPAGYSGPGLTIPDEVVTVANGATVMYPSLPIFKQATGNMIVTCDGTAKVLVGRPQIQ